MVADGRVMDYSNGMEGREERGEGREEEKEEVAGGDEDKWKRKKWVRWWCVGGDADDGHGGLRGCKRGGKEGGRAHT